MFLRQIERDCGSPARRFDEIELPMSRSDIASYLGLSLESTSRATRTLESLGIVSFPGRHRARILDPVRFKKIEAKLSQSSSPIIDTALVPGLGRRAAGVQQALCEKLIDHTQYVVRYGEDTPEVRDGARGRAVHQGRVSIAVSQKGPCVWRLRSSWKAFRGLSG